jgi:hypothetical protein
MKARTIHNLSPSELVNGLDPEVIAARLVELERESQALRVLLRSARARQAGKKRAKPGGEGKGATNAP